tara:strand:+ start:209 stop:376 length:168 start_codon:yes stop_codon:yes gene_type:complete
MTRQLKTEEDQKAIDEWLKHNKITECAPEERTPEEDVVYKFRAGKRGRTPSAKST